MQRPSPERAILIIRAEISKGGRQSARSPSLIAATVSRSPQCYGVTDLREFRHRHNVNTHYYRRHLCAPELQDETCLYGLVALLSFSARHRAIASDLLNRFSFCPRTSLPPFARTRSENLDVPCAARRRDSSVTSQVGTVIVRRHVSQRPWFLTFLHFSLARVGPKPSRL